MRKNNRFVDLQYVVLCFPKRFYMWRLRHNCRRFTEGGVYLVEKFDKAKNISVKREVPL